jgi:hypothetical protein
MAIDGVKPFLPGSEKYFAISRLAAQAVSVPSAMQLARFDS